MEKLTILIPERMSGLRLDVALSEMLPDQSRTKITAWIKSGNALIKQKTFKPKDKSNGMEVIELKISKTQNNDWSAEDIALSIVYEDDDIIVVNKPAGLVTHPGAGNQNGTLANALLHYDSNLKLLDRAGIVHRLDKDTSGLLVVARNEKSQKNLVEQMQMHSVSREYSAIVYGHMVAGGTVNEPISRDSRDRTKQAVSKSGKEAVTHYRVIDRFQNHTHIKAVLETGRTHQIRVHMSHIGYPLIGDSIYGGKVRFPKKASEELKVALKNFNRQGLHAKKLSLTHPSSGSTLSWKAPIPDDMLELLKASSMYDLC